MRREQGKRALTASARRLFLALAAVLLSTVSAMPAGTVFAAVNGARGPGEAGKSPAELNGYSEERWAALMDNRLEYEEIDDLVHSFNPAIVSAWSNLNESIQQMEIMTDNLKARQRDMQQLKDNAKAAGEIADYANYAMQEAILRASAHSLRESAEKMGRKETSSNRPLRVAERQAAAGVKQLMISYNGLLAQREIVAESEQLSARVCEDIRQKRSVGLATEAEVNGAETNLLKLQSQLSGLDATAAQLKKNLILLCGWKEGADPEIGETPAADPVRLAGMDPETDLRQAIAKNGTIIDFRNAGHDKSTLSWELRANTEEQMNQNLLVNLRAMRQDAEANSAALAAAQSGMQAAELTKNAAELQYSLGMLSASQYMGALTQYQSARTALLTADSTLFQSLEIYDWALQGNASVQ